jgi:hypothetical protein
MAALLLRPRNSGAFSRGAFCHLFFFRCWTKAFGHALHKMVFEFWMVGWKYPFACTIMAGVFVLGEWPCVSHEHGSEFLCSMEGPVFCMTMGRSLEFLFLFLRSFYSWWLS